MEIGYKNVAKGVTNSIYMKTIRSLRKLVGWQYQQFFNKGEVVVHGRFLGHEIKTVKGTIRPKADQDDAWFFYLVKNSERIFDIGANIGYTGIISALQENTKQILLVDPNPEALAIAAKNLILNNLGSKCRFYAAFVSDRAGDKVKFYTVGSGAAGSMFRGHAETAAALNRYHLVETVTVDFLSEYLEWTPDLVKIDVEGAESFVLEGARQIAAYQKTIFMVEMHSPPELPMRENATKIIQWCNSVGYTPWYMKEKRILTHADHIAHRGKCHLLLQPKDWKYPHFLKDVEQGAPLPEK